MNEINTNKTEPSENIISQKKRFGLIFFTGAGISVESGVPTFDEQPGLRDQLSRSFAITHTEEYRETIFNMRDICRKAQPNEAHYAIAKTGCPVITMNIDRLHKRAHTSNLLEIHGRLPDDNEIKADNFRYLLNIPVLYGDPAPQYKIAEKLVSFLRYNNSYFVIVGTSFYTGISETLMRIAKKRKANIIIINDNAATKVPELCDKLKKMGVF